MRRLLLLAVAGIAFVSVVSGGARPSGLVQTRWVRTDLSAPEGFGDCGATDINSQGWVVGECRGGKPEVSRAVLWRNGKIRSLGVLPGKTASSATAINDVGQVVGASFLGSADDPKRVTGFLWQNGKMRSLRLGGSRFATWPWDVNNTGQVVGELAGAYGPDPDGGEGAWVWLDGKVRYLPSEGAAVAINNRGQIVGPNYLWDGQKTPLAFPGRAINDRGQVVGWFTFRKTGQTTACLWEGGKLTDLGTLPSDTSSSAAAINNRGQIVGSSADFRLGNVHAFVWQQGKMTALGTVSGSPWSDATAINNHGQIVGSATTTTGQTHAVLWTLRSG